MYLFEPVRFFFSFLCEEVNNNKMGKISQEEFDRQLDKVEAQFLCSKPTEQIDWMVTEIHCNYNKIVPSRCSRTYFIRKT